MRADLLALLVLAAVRPAAAQSADAMSGDYVCASGCRLTDAAPSVRIAGGGAVCTNEFGGVFGGHVLTANTLSCFNKVGELSGDGKTLRWSDGVIWTRVR